MIAESKMHHLTSKNIQMVHKTRKYAPNASEKGANGGIMNITFLPNFCLIFDAVCIFGTLTIIFDNHIGIMEKVL